MRSLTVLPGTAGSAELTEIDEPPDSDGSVLVQTLAVGICGTDKEIVAGEYGAAPDGHTRLVLGHESLGRVVSAPQDSGFTVGDLVVAMVRHPDPVPCENCAAGQWDMCRNGKYTEHGIMRRDGFMRERYRVDPDRLVRVDAKLGGAGVLLEPTSVVVKAWDQVDHAMSRMAYRPKTALVTGAGPIGLLAAMIGVQRGLEVHVLDQVTDGPKPQLVADLGAQYTSASLDDFDLKPDVVIECTGVPQVVVGAMRTTGVDGVTVLTGVSTTGRSIDLDIGSLNREIVLQNDVVVGSVNANRKHYDDGATALASADRSWLDRITSRHEPLESFDAAFKQKDDDIKVVLQISDDA